MRRVSILEKKADSTSTTAQITMEIFLRFDCTPSSRAPCSGVLVQINGADIDPPRHDRAAAGCERRCRGIPNGIRHCHEGRGDFSEQGVSVKGILPFGGIVQNQAGTVGDDDGVMLMSSRRFMACPTPSAVSVSDTARALAITVA
jgi:hypothetical protein